MNFYRNNQPINIFQNDVLDIFCLNSVLQLLTIKYQALICLYLTVHN